MGVEHARKFAMQTIAHRVGSYEDNLHGRQKQGAIQASSGQINPHPEPPIQDPCQQENIDPAQELRAGIKQPTTICRRQPQRRD
jgi:hypothetical protein